METLSVLQSLIMALWVAAIMSRWLGGGATLTLRFSPLMTGLVAGLVMGDVPKAMIVTAALQMIYMGVFSPGGSMPAEPSIAAAIAVPVALLGNLKPEAAIAVAVPVGLLGSYLYQFRFFINTFLGKYTDRAVAELNSKKNCPLNYLVSNDCLIYFIRSISLFCSLSRGTSHCRYY